MCNYKNREKAMVVLRISETGRPTVWCDPCIAPVVDALNTANMPTVASCCGHGEAPGSISLRDGRQIIIAKDLAEHSVMLAAVRTGGEVIPPEPKAGEAQS